MHCLYLSLNGHRPLRLRYRRQRLYIRTKELHRLRYLSHCTLAFQNAKSESSQQFFVHRSLPSVRIVEVRRVCVNIVPFQLNCGSEMFWNCRHGMYTFMKNVNPGRSNLLCSYSCKMYLQFHFGQTYVIGLNQLRHSRQPYL